MADQTFSFQKNEQILRLCQNHHIFFIILVTFVFFLTPDNFFANATPIKSVNKRQSSVDYQVSSYLDIKDETASYSADPINDFDINANLEYDSELFRPNPLETNDLFNKLPSIHWNALQSSAESQESGNLEPIFSQNGNTSSSKLSFVNPYNANESIWRDSKNYYKIGSTLQPITEEEENEYKFFVVGAKVAYCKRKIENTSSTVTRGDPSDKTKLSLAIAADDGKLQLALSNTGCKLVSYPGKSGAKVNNCSYEIYDKFVQNLVETILISISQSQIDKVSLVGFGYSGVLAQLVGLSLSEKIDKSIQLSITTFGQPRLGNAKFALALNQVAKVIRFTHGHDPVPRQPIEYQGEKYVHSGTEIWDTGTGPIFSCPLENETLNMAGESEDSKTTPNDYFGPYLGLSFEGCKDVENLLKLKSEVAFTSF
ncbi:hypothetical protein G9A89_002643 [Geosiphon pyriformis]|nr:hypothetical protein G9A89_002643 [Geosiphon pyriformis]